MTQSEDFVTAARAAAWDAQLVPVDIDHMGIIDPSKASWTTVVAAVEELAAATG